MTGDNLTLEYDADDRAVWLIVTSAGGTEYKEPLWLREGYGIDEVREAILATGWVRQDENEYCLASDIRCATMRDVVDEMFTYFKAPGVPSKELLDVQSAVSEYDIVQRLSSEIPLFAYAWLDLMVREDLADAARSEENVWNNSEVTVEVDKYCDRRVAELMFRYSHSASNVLSRMAGSIPSRTFEQSGGAKTG